LLKIIKKFFPYISQQKLAHIILNTDIYEVVYKEISWFFSERYQQPRRFLI